MTIGRSEIVLAAMAAGGSGARFFPVQLQNLLFLIDREIPELVHGPHFRFIPYYYGPFDKGLYVELGRLARTGKINADKEDRYPQYFLNDTGMLAGTHTLTGLSEPAPRYMKESAAWARSLTFKQLAIAIYAHFPDMAVNSMMPQLKPNSGRARLFPKPSFLSGLARTLDFMGTLNEYRPRRTERSQDAEKLGRDWAKVGQNLRSAIEVHVTERDYS